MSNIIWKNISSDTIKGLLISELPSITKPSIRTSITEIEGKDGDIVEELGYSSYDKTIKIGLTKDYNIDEIIKYFTGTGDLILSNEPDKVYKASIYNQINYEKLLRFKTATVEFHVQPYKYLKNEKIVSLNITNEKELEVNNVGLEDSKPIITLYGEGIVDIYINDLEIFKINIDEDFVIIDSLEEEAYKDDNLKNRNMTGEFPILKTGTNKISWSGNLTKIEIQPKSRWL